MSDTPREQVYLADGGRALELLEAWQKLILILEDHGRWFAEKHGGSGYTLYGKRALAGITTEKNVKPNKSWCVAKGASRVSDRKTFTPATRKKAGEVVMQATWDEMQQADINETAIKKSLGWKGDIVHGRTLATMKFGWYGSHLFISVPIISEAVAHVNAGRKYELVPGFRPITNLQYDSIVSGVIEVGDVVQYKLGNNVPTNHMVMRIDTHFGDSDNRKAYQVPRLELSNISRLIPIDQLKLYRKHGI